MNDGETWRSAFSERVDIAPGTSFIVYYDSDRGEFVVTSGRSVDW